MKVYPEIKKIAEKIEEVETMVETISDKFDVDGCVWTSATLIDGCVIQDNKLYQDGERLDNSTIVDDLYFCNQHTGYCEDDYYGTLYFKTDTPGQFVAVPYSC